MHLPSRFDRTERPRYGRFWRMAWLRHEEEAERRRLHLNLGLELGERAAGWIR